MGSRIINEAVVHSNVSEMVIADSTATITTGQTFSYPANGPTLAVCRPPGIPFLFLPSPYLAYTGLKDAHLFV